MSRPKKTDVARKTHLANTFLASVTNTKQKALTVAGTGISSVLLPREQTFHSRFQCEYITKTKTTVMTNDKIQTQCQRKKRKNLENDDENKNKNKIGANASRNCIVEIHQRGLPHIFMTLTKNNDY